MSTGKRIAKIEEELMFNNKRYKEAVEFYDKTYSYDAMYLKKYYYGICTGLITALNILRKEDEEEL